MTRMSSEREYLRSVAEHASGERLGGLVLIAGILIAFAIIVAVILIGVL